MAKQDDWVRITLRLPSELHASLLSAVAEGPNSLNAEIVARLQSTLGQEPSGLDETIIRRIIDEAARTTAVEIISNFEPTIFEKKSGIRPERTYTLREKPASDDEGS